MHCRDADEDDVFREAGENMRKAAVTQDDLLRRREDAIRDYEWGLSRARSMGRTEGRAEDVKALMDNLGLSFEKAVAALNISEDDAEKIKNTL